MQIHRLVPSRASRVLVLGIWAAALAACNLHIGTGVEARDAWTRSYPVKPGILLEIRETVGLVQIEAGDGDHIIVNATRVTKAATEEAAKAMLAEYNITETLSPEQIILDGTSPGLSLGLNKSRHVDYQIKVPRATAVTIKSVTSDIRVTGIAGALRVETTNGDITGTALGDGADIRSVNGTVTLDLASLGEAGVRCNLTNGTVNITMPADSKATLHANLVNGDIQTERLNVDVREKTGRRLSGTVGGGGPDVRIEMVNGDVKIAGK
ncbi:MAG TPA: DUF4097 family beta strand repeat-containing protein [Vicinamibacterales bacterium]|nr:DUF4097 family beta strand repeat-containing protein [Vicinamibacterales bacterium]